MTAQPGEVTVESIVAARLRTGSVADKTPLDYSATLTRPVGVHCYLKLENLQLAAVELMVETRDAEHIAEIIARLQERGYVVERCD
ncbi:hypothetical protein [Desulfurispora thermophila]|uniref:hypothetical protein n=1 Tax=Desulfurispora thermophila TaxID=265470 RepID=UPI00036C53AF|nr:hypothetical protein [Desulfurispora thermophila]